MTHGDLVLGNRDEPAIFEQIVKVLFLLLANFHDFAANCTILTFKKREKVCYRQNNIIAYQDHAWGDGEILIDYRCSPGYVVDSYRPGQKTFLLISLRERKRRGDIDEFHMEWEMRDAFARSQELWETEIRHQTKKMTMKIIFPRARPPQNVWLFESLRRRKHQLGPDAKKRIHDGRWLVTWECDRPKLNERYQLHWEW